MKINNTHSSSKKSRRDFLKQFSLGVGAASIAIASPSFASSLFRPKLKSGNKRLGIALVGLGSYSTYQLAPALQETENCYLAGIVTGTPSKAESWMDKYDIPKQNIYNYENFDEITNNKDIDIIYVVLPNSMHAEFTIRAARAGKHVICEKPMALNVTECESMIKACEDNKVRLAIGYRIQFEETMKEVMRLGQEEEFGKIQLINGSAGFLMRDNKNWRTRKNMGGGPMQDIGIYALNAARMITGQEPLWVTAQAYNSRPELFTEINETVTWQMQFTGGAIANLTGSFGMYVRDLFVTAEDGWISMNPYWTYNGIRATTSDGPIEFPERFQQAVQLDEMARCFMENETFRADGYEGLKDVKIINAIEESILNDGKKITII
ncbi:MAG: Gfo/Idh/MocA family oxidoreductase [bacterium]